MSYYWILDEKGKKYTTAGKTRDIAENHAARYAYFLKRPVRFIGPELGQQNIDEGVIEPKDIYTVSPAPKTKKALKEGVKRGVIFRAVGCDHTGTVFVASDASKYGSSWVAKVEVNEGYIRKIIR